jgi:hypothetical protein
LVKTFVKALNKVEEEFIYLMQKFLRISEDKIKTGIFVGSQVKQLFQDPNVRNQLNSAERRDWEAFENIYTYFSRNKKIGELCRNVEELLSSYCALGCNMLLKLHFLQSHWIFSREIWEPCLTSTVIGSIRIYSMWKKDTVANVTQTCWLITAGRSHMRHQQKNTRDKR